MKTAELTGPALDWAVALAEGHKPPLLRVLRGNVALPVEGDEVWCEYLEYLEYSSDWAQGGPIIERECIELSPPFTSLDGMAFPTWYAVIKDKAGQMAYTPLGAAMRCYVASKLGDEIEIPKELTC